jgi:hypothetical protein
MSHLKLRAPDQLPPHGLTLQQFKPWKITFATISDKTVTMPSSSQAKYTPPGALKKQRMTASRNFMPRIQTQPS